MICFCSNLDAQPRRSTTINFFFSAVSFWAGAAAVVAAVVFQRVMAGNLWRRHGPDQEVWLLSLRAPVAVDAAYGGTRSATVGTSQRTEHLLLLVLHNSFPRHLLFLLQYDIQILVDGV